MDYGIKGLKKTKRKAYNFVSLSFLTLKMWAQLGLNQRPPDYESGATNQLSYGP